MNKKTIVAVTLIAVGVVLATLALNLLAPGNPREFPRLNLAGYGRFIPPVADGLVFVVGILFLLAKSKRAK